MVSFAILRCLLMLSVTLSTVEPRTSGAATTASKGFASRVGKPVVRNRVSQAARAIVLTRGPWSSQGLVDR